MSLSLWSKYMKTLSQNQLVSFIYQMVKQHLGRGLLTCVSFVSTSRGPCWSRRPMFSVISWRSVLRICWMVPSANWRCSLETNSSCAKPTRSSGTCWDRSSARWEMSYLCWRDRGLRLVVLMFTFLMQTDSVFIDWSVFLQKSVWWLFLVLSLADECVTVAALQIARFTRLEPVPSAKWALISSHPYWHAIKPSKCVVVQ